MKSFFRIIAVLSLFLNGCVYHNFKGMPLGTDYAGKTYRVSDDQIDFLYDLTYEKDGERVSEQEIFDTIFQHIKQAKEYILIDMFLFNKYMGSQDQSYRDVCGEMTDLLIQKSIEDSVKIDFITDPINNVYGGDHSPELDAMKAAGINVIITDLDKLPDSNEIYSPIWRTFFQWFGNKQDSGILPNPFTTNDKVTLRTYLRLINFKANHRKIFLVDYQDSWASLITSANPHNGSSAHSNVGILVYGNFAQDLYWAEQAVADFSEAKLSDAMQVLPVKDGDIKLRLITEQEIKLHLLGEINQTAENDSIKIGMFYLSDRDVIASLIKASERGTCIKLILDPNKDAFGRKKNGVPNRPVAYELHKKSNGKIKIKWYNTHGEQFHSKFAYFQHSQKTDTMIIGSANFTHRNIGNKNLEIDVLIKADSETKFMREVADYFDLVWNEEGYCLEYSTYSGKSLWKKFLYRISEGLGANTF